jgi:DNA polymerase-4
VRPERETKSVSAETTFEADIASFEELRPILWRLCERVSGRLKAAGLAGRTVTLKLKDGGLTACAPGPGRAGRGGAPGTGK